MPKRLAKLLLVFIFSTVILLLILLTLRDYWKKYQNYKNEQSEFSFFKKKEKLKNYKPFNIRYITKLSNHNEKIDLLAGIQVEYDYIVIHIFASWCKICNKEINELIKLKSLLIDQKKRVKFIGLVWKDDNDSVVKSLGGKISIYEQLGLISNKEAIELGIITLPTTFVINSNNKVIYRNDNDYNFNLYSNAKEIFK